MMDFDKLIDKDASGTYCILFKNKFGMELDEIEEIFSEFGKVTNIRTHGDAYGYRFIRYKNIEEAENAILSLDGHPKITFSEHRKKNGENKINGKKNNKSSLTNGKDKKSQKNNEINSLDEQESTFLNSSPSYTKKDCDIAPWATSSKGDDDTRSIKSLSAASVSSTLTHKSPKLIGEKKTPSTDDEVPDLTITKNSIPKKKQILESQEVIVANINEKYGPAYILHLFESYEPLAITKIFQHSSIRYCHVYFKTLQDAVDVENDFDKKNLAGQKLLVLRPRKLIMEATCS